MINEPPITPSPELVQQWASTQAFDIAPAWMLNDVATQAAQWGADQELEASVSWLIENQNPRWAHALRAARRPKSPSLKEDALAALHGIHDQGPTPEQVVTIRRALEALPDD